MGVFNTWWFWLLILSIVGFIVAFSSYETLGQNWNSDPNSSVPWWIWIVFAISLVLFIIAGSLYWRGAVVEYKQNLQDIACGKVKAPEEVIVCPVDPCNPNVAPKQMTVHSGPTFKEKLDCVPIPNKETFVFVPQDGGAYKTVAIPISALSPAL